MSRTQKEVREKMVTRTFDISLVTCMCLNVVSAEVSTNTFEVVGLYTDNENALKAVKRIAESDEFKVVTVTKMEHFERLYGMIESEFIAYAKVLPPRGTKSEE